MSINILKNYKTPQYTEFKKLVLNNEFPWRYLDSDTGIYFYGHGLLTRPEGKYSEAISQYSEFGMSVVDEILQHNNIQYKFFLRSALNCLHPDNDVQSSAPHVDHDFPHINVIIYLTNTGGKTYCGDEFHDPKEDDVILLTGEHWGERPKVGRRIILVTTLFI